MSTQVTLMQLYRMAVLGSAYLSLLGRLLCVQVCIVLVCEGLGLHQEVPQVLLEG